MKLRETKKLHYNKFLYKLTIPTECASYFRTEFQPAGGTLQYARQRIDRLNLAYIPGKEYIKVLGPYISRTHDSVHVNSYFDAIEVYRHLRKPNVKPYIIRCEHNVLNIYSNERKWLITLSNNLHTKFSEFWEPDPGNINLLLSETNIIIVNKKPEYIYKCTLGKQKGSPALANWIENNPHLAKMGDNALAYCKKSDYVKGLYFFVRDQKVLTIAQLIVGANLQRIDRLSYTYK